MIMIALRVNDRTDNNYSIWLTTHAIAAPYRRSIPPAILQKRSTTQSIAVTVSAFGIGEVAALSTTAARACVCVCVQVVWYPSLASVSKDTI